MSAATSGVTADAWIGPEPDDEDDGKTHEQTDLRNSERLVEKHGPDIRYVTTWGAWIVWRGDRWAVADDDGEVMQRAVDVARHMLDAAGTAVELATHALVEAAKSHGEGSEQAKKAEKALQRASKAFSFAAKSQGERPLKAMVALAKISKSIRITHDVLDTDTMLLNCPNGTVDLRTGVLRDHSRADLLTKCTAAPFDGRARSELWDRVLLEAMGGDAELVSYVQRAAGYSCTGRTGEEKLFLVVGPTRGGKSTIVQAMLGALGDYGRTADFEAFLQQKNPNSGPRNGLARLAGARLVVSSEVDKGRRLAQGLLKTLTGSDKIMASHVFEREFEYLPQFKLWLVANDAPLVTDDDPAMWERIQRVPFPCTVPADRRDPKVKEELVDVERSGAAILAWMVEGCLRWQAKGLGKAAAVTEATQEYRAEQDPLRDFITEACLLAPTVQCSRKELRAAYEAWVDEAGGRTPMTGQAFSERIRKLPGVGEKIVKGVRVWTGLGLMAGARFSQGAGVQMGAEKS